MHVPHLGVGSISLTSGTSRLTRKVSLGLLACLFTATLCLFAGALRAETATRGTCPNTTLPWVDAEHPEQILQQLTQPANQNTRRFVELRAHPMLQNLLILRGNVTFTDQGTLIKQTIEPYAETLKFDGKYITRTRNDKTRRWSTKRLGAMADYLRLFNQLINGKQTQLLDNFKVSGWYDNDDWQLRLTAKQQTSRTKDQTIWVCGTGASIDAVRTERAEAWEEIQFLADDPRTDSQT